MIESISDSGIFSNARDALTLTIFTLVLEKMYPDSSVTPALNASLDLEIVFQYS